MTLIAAKLRASLGDGAKALFDADVWSGYTVNHECDLLLQTGLATAHLLQWTSILRLRYRVRD